MQSTHTLVIRVLCLFTLTMLFASGVLALGVSPARITVHAGTDTPIFSFRVLPAPAETGTLSVRLDGALASYATLEEIRLSDSDPFVRGVLSLPEDLPPGEHLLEVVFSHQGASSGTVSASTEVAGQVLVKVPYPDQYIVASWNLQPDPQTLSARGTVTIENLGRETVVPEAMILSLLDGKTTVSEVSLSPIAVAPGSFAKIQGIIPSVSAPGEYDSLLHIEYGEKIFTEIRSVAVGVPTVRLAKVLASPEQNGQILPIDVQGTILWNRPVVVTFQVFRDDILLYEEQNVSLEKTFSHRLYVESVDDFSTPLSLTMILAGERVSVLVPLNASSALSDRLPWVWFIAFILVLIVCGLLYWKKRQH